MWDEAQADHVGAGSFGLIAGEIATIDGIVDNILVDTDTTIPGLIAALNDIAAADVWAVGSRTITGLTAAALADFFDTDSGTTYAAAVAGSVVRETADNAGGSALTEAGIADAVWDELQSGHVAVVSFGEVATEVASILADTNELQTDNVPGLIAALNDLTAAQVNAEVDTALADYDGPTRAELTSDINSLNDITVADILTTQMTESYAAAGTAPSLAQALFLMHQQLGDFIISGTTLTVRDLAGTGVATFTLNDGTDPTAIDRTT